MASENELIRRIAQLEARVKRLESEKGVIIEEEPQEKPVIKEKTGPDPISQGNWFARIGIVAVILGIGFFLKLAFDNNWIGPGLRVLIGIGLGVGMLAGSELFLKKYKTYARIVGGGGIAALYLSVYAASGFYNLITPLLSCVGMALVTATSMALSFKTNEKSILAVGILGGFLAPILFLKTVPQEYLIIYLLSINIGVITVSFLKKWEVFIPFSIFGSYLNFCGWYFMSRPSVSQAEILLTLIFGVFFTSSVLWHIFLKQKGSQEAYFSLSGNAVFYFTLSYYIVRDTQYMGLFTVVLGLLYGALGLVSLKKLKDAQMTSLFLGISFVLFLIAVPIQLKGEWISIAWSAEALAFVMISYFSGQAIYKKFSVAAFLLTGGYFLLKGADINSFHSSMLYSSGFSYSTLPLLSLMEWKIPPMLFISQLLSVVFASVSAYVLLFGLKKKGIRKEDGFVSFFCIFASVVLLITLTQRVVSIVDAGRTDLIARQTQAQRDYYKRINDQQSVPQWGIAPRPVSQENSEEFLRQQEQIETEIKALNNRKNFSISLLWAVYAIGMLLLGITLRLGSLRIVGLGLFGLTIIKVFALDIFQVGGVYRVASLISLGVVLLVTGFIYQKYNKKIKELLSS